jgi:hypothetical protein
MVPPNVDVYNFYCYLCSIEHELMNLLHLVFVGNFTARNLVILPVCRLCNPYKLKI